VLFIKTCNYSTGIIPKTNKTNKTANLHRRGEWTGWWRRWQ